MFIQIDVPPDPGRLRRLIRGTLRRVILAYGAVGVLLIAGGVIAILTGRFGSTASWLIAGGIAALVLVVLIGRGPRGQKEIINGPWHYIVDETGVHVRSATITGSYAWAAFRSARVTGTDVVLHMGPRMIIGIPRDRIAPADQERLTALLTDHGLLAASR